MNPLLAGVALVVVAGTVVALSASQPRTVVLAMAAVLAATPFLADPVADPLALAARVLGATLGAYLLWMAVRRGAGDAWHAIHAEGSRIGWPAEALLAAAAAVAGLGAAGLGIVAHGPALASGAGFAVAAVALIPVLTSRDILRMGIALLLLVHAALLVRVTLGGTPAPAEQLLTAVLVVVSAGIVAALANAARLDGDEAFSIARDIRPRVRRGPDAHPIHPVDPA